MKKLRLITLLIITCLNHSYAGDMSASDAFSLGKSIGDSGKDSNYNGINTTNANNNVPGYTATSTESQYYQDGNGTITPPAYTDVQNCLNTTTDPSKQKYGHCESVRMINQSKGKARSMFAMDPTSDPLLVKGKNAQKNPSDYTGSMGTDGTYSGCVDRVVKDPDITSEEICNQGRTVENYTCTRGFSPNMGVKVTDNTFNQNPGGSVGQFSARTFNYDMTVDGAPTTFVLNYYQIDNYGQLWINDQLVYQNSLYGSNDLRNGSVGQVCSAFFGGQQCSFVYYNAAGASLGSFYDDDCNSGCRGISMARDITQYFKQGSNKITLVCLNARKVGPCTVNITGRGRKLEYLGSLVDNKCAPYEARAQ